MDFIDVIKTRRTIRLFKDQPVPAQLLLDLVDCARLAPSAANRQPLQFVIVDDPDLCTRLFENLAWAGFVTPKRNPPAGKRPTAYIVVITNPEISSVTACSVDAAAAIANILLAAWSKGVGSCWLGAIKRDEIKTLLAIPDHLNINSVVALGYPAESPVSENAAQDVKYYLDESDNLHVPKRILAQITSRNGFGRGL
ncbi:MAG: hypothetical protein A2Y07_00860 [Planctomycetes bacterium GWF2_50_10]|nr:MAG: hypothetical protein A2Y07_00860 [Planctomycetes bacterium GWF2_50_10]